MVRVVACASEPERACMRTQAVLVELQIEASSGSRFVSCMRSPFAPIEPNEWIDAAAHTRVSSPLSDLLGERK